MAGSNGEQESEAKWQIEVSILEVHNLPKPKNNPESKREKTRASGKAKFLLFTLSTMIFA